PSTTSAATQLSSTSIPTQKSKSPITVTTVTSTKRRRTVDDNVNKDGDLWEFPIETPERATRRSTTIETRRTRKNPKVMEETAATSRTTRRTSTAAVTESVGARERTGNSSNEIDEFPRMAKKRKLTEQT